MKEGDAKHGKVHLKVVQSSLLTPSPDFGQYLISFVLSIKPRARALTVRAATENRLRVEALKWIISSSCH